MIENLFGNLFSGGHISVTGDELNMMRQQAMMGQQATYSNLNRHCRSGIGQVINSEDMVRSRTKLAVVSKGNRYSQWRKRYKFRDKEFKNK